MFIDVVDPRVKQWLVDQRIRALSSSGATHACVEECFGARVVLAIVYVRALALRAYVLHSLWHFPEYLHVTLCERIVCIEEEISSVVFLEVGGVARPWFFDSFEVPRIVVIIDVGQKVPSVQVVIAVCLRL